MALTEGEYESCRRELEQLEAEYDARGGVPLEAVIRLGELRAALAESRPRQNTFWLPGLPDPLGLVEKLTDGMVRDPFREFVIKPLSKR